MKIAIILVVFFGALLISIGLFSLTGVPNETSQEAFYPEPTNYVVDAAGSLSPTVVDSLNHDLKEFDLGGKAQIAVAVIKTTSPITIEEYGIKLAEKWGVGHVGKDDGLIIILAVEDRKVRIEVGKGLEGNIPDAVAGRIVDEAMISHLKESKWDEAIIAGVETIKSKIK